MKRQEERRKNYFIKRQFQRRFILRFCGLVILGSAISAVFLYMFSRGTLTTAFIRSHLSIVSTATYILPALIGSSLVTIILISLATAVVVMYQSHKIAGPLFKVERSAQQIGQGDLTREVKLRCGDEMEKLAACFNQMAQELNQAIKDVKSQAQDLGRLIDSLAQKAEKGIYGKEIENALKELSEKKKNLDNAIDFFKL